MSQGEINWQMRYMELCNKLMHEFTPGGSEFYQDADRCIRFAKGKIISGDDFRMRTMIHLRKHPFIYLLWRRSHGANPTA